MNNGDGKFQVIVVGGGPAGVAASYTLAQAGIKTALIERGVYPGSKNVMGGILYTHPVSQVIPNFWEEAPLERPILDHQFWTLAPGAVVAVKHQSERFRTQPYNSYSVLRAKFDPWFARQADHAGAYVINKTTVQDLIFDSGRVVGIQTDRPDGDLYADVVILADGVNSLLAQRAGLRAELGPSQVALAVKEVLALPKETIDERFNMDGGFGVAIDLYGNVARGMAGSGFIYTNKDTLSVGLGVMLSDLVKQRARPYDLLEEMKNHPSIKPLLRGAETREYMAHMIPEGGYKAMPKLYGAGVMVAGDAAQMVNGVHREGANLAMTSGKLAAETAIVALKRGDFSEKSLRDYQSALADSFVLKDLKKYKNFPAFVHSHHQLFSIIPEVVAKAADEFFVVDSVPKLDKEKGIWSRLIRPRLSLLRSVKDLYQAWRAVR